MSAKRVGPSNVLLSGRPSSTADMDREQVARIRRVYEGKLLPDALVDTFRSADRLFSTRVVRRGAQTQQLPRSKVPLRELRIRAKGADYDLVDYLSRNRVAGLLILKKRIPEVLWLVALAHLSLSSVRHAPLYALVAAPSPGCSPPGGATTGRGVPPPSTCSTSASAPR